MLFPCVKKKKKEGWSHKTGQNGPAFLCVGLVWMTFGGAAQLGLLFNSLSLMTCNLFPLLCSNALAIQVVLLVELERIPAASLVQKCNVMMLAG